MSIGTFGSVTFEAAEKKVRTFDEFKRTTSAKYEEHAIIGQKPLLEFVALGLDTITFQMVFSVSLGLNPAKEVQMLREILQKYQYYPLIIGSKSLGNFVIENLSETWRHVDNRGNPLHIAVDVSLKEYATTSVSTNQTTVTAAAETANVTKVNNAIQTAANSVGLSATSTQSLAKVAQTATKNPVTAAAATKQILSTVKTLQNISKSTDIATALSAAGVKTSSYSVLGLNPVSLVSKTKSDPAGAIVELLTAIDNSTGKDKLSATKNIVGSANAGSTIQIAKEMKGVVNL